MRGTLSGTPVLEYSSTIVRVPGTSVRCCWTHFIRVCSAVSGGEGTTEGRSPNFNTILRVPSQMAHSTTFYDYGHVHLACFIFSTKVYDAPSPGRYRCLERVGNATIVLLKRCVAEANIARTVGSNVRANRVEIGRLLTLRTAHSSVS